MLTLSKIFLSPSNLQIVLGRVVCTVVPDSGLPFAFCMVDRDGTCRAVTVYNWASNCGVKIGDAVAIVAPILKRHKIQSEKVGLNSIYKPISHL